MSTASWVIIEKSTGRVLFETFNANVPRAINSDKYAAVPIQDYLVSVNGRAK